jgi:4-amino-4-deoxy-L-arabinose transferase-like glycosyltransferase
MAAGQALDGDYWTKLLVALGALLVFRLTAIVLAETDIFFDEAQYWLWSRELAFGYFSKPPLIAWLIRLATEICGDAEWCIRAPSPILYTISAIFVFLAGRALYGPRIGFWSALVFATLPGTSVSALLISTDVPLLVCWTIALYAWIRLVATKRMAFALLAGGSIGVGLLAKYAALYFLLCIVIDAWTDKDARDALRQRRGIAILGLALAIVAPNIAWNASHQFATFSHTAGNAGWKSFPIHVGSAAEFLGTQFAVFGPILFAALLIVAWRAWREGSDRTQSRLLSFSLPVLAVLLIQALFSRALANWAAAAYPAATILVTAALLRTWPRLLRLSLWLHLAALIFLTLAPIFATQVTRLTGPDWNPYGRLLGWRQAAEATRALAAKHGAKTVLTDTREATAELLYYLRDSSLPVLIWFYGDGSPRNHFEMTNPFTARAAEPVIYVTLNRERSAIPKRFASAEIVATGAFPSEASPLLEGRFYLLKGFNDGRN